MIKTNCDECIFSVSENGEQVGCKFNRLKVFKELGIAEKKDNGFYTIDRLCLACRNSKGSYEDPEKEVLKEIAPKVTVLLDYRDNSFNEELLKDVVKEKPFQLLIVFKDQKISEYNKIISNIVEDTGVKYRIVRFLEDNPIESVYKYVEGNYIIIGDSIAPGIIQELSDAIVYDLKKYLVYSKKDCHIISTILFKYKTQDIVEIKEYLKSKDDYQDFLCEK